MKFTATVALLVIAMNASTITTVMAATSTGAATATANSNSGSGGVTFRPPRGVSPNGSGAFFKDAEQQQQQQAETLPLVTATTAMGVSMGVRGGEEEMTFQHRMKIGFYFALWYFLNVVYNSK